MKERQFKFYFKGGPITVWAFNEEDARNIMAKMEDEEYGHSKQI